MRPSVDPVGKTFKGRKFMKTANGGPMRAIIQMLEKLMINATFGGPLWTSHLKVEN